MDVQVGSVILSISYLSVILLSSCAQFIPCTFLLLHYDLNVTYVCAEGRLARTGWEIRPRPRTVILLKTSVSQSVSLSLVCFSSSGLAETQ